jgi:phosphatidylglycerol:prolipoprotein diacylglycerol transferase
MYPYIHIGHFAIGTFGIMLWLAAVTGCWALQSNFKRWGIQADAITIVAFATVLGVVGAKLWHVLESPHIFLAHPLDLLLDRAGFAWFGGLVAGILALLWQGRTYRIPSLRMLDLCAPAAAIGYGVGRIGCFTSGDGDYGVPTSLPWGVSFPHGLVPTLQRVHPTPIYELLGAIVIFAILWRRGRPGSLRKTGEITGEYLLLSGFGRFLVEFIRINPKIYWGMSNAQVASLGSMAAGILLMIWARRYGTIPARAGLPHGDETPVLAGAQAAANPKAR